MSTVQASEPQGESDQAPSTEPRAVVTALIDAMQANDAERIRSLFDANASQAYGDGPAKSGAAFFSWLDSDIINRQGRVENAQLAVDGNQVVVTGQYRSRGYTSAANFLMTVENGRITSWRMRY
ncbi:MAG: nuclear transport factor 2 family protein [Candidatus Competibacteraceae bacterium]|nr:nuclear transport factor 2 family protein [Candidatus Competibacteraceae bacterium]